MANLKNINFMSQDTFENIEQADDELYAVSASGIGFPSDKYEELTLGASGTQYTAPANGWFFFAKGATSTTQSSMDIYDSTGVILLYKIVGGTDQNGTTGGCYAPIQKGNIMKLKYDLAGTLSMFRFVYAKGE